MWQTSLLIFITLGVWPAFVALAWIAHRRGGGRALLGLWVGASLAYGYVQYRLTCTQGMSCCVRGTNPWFLTGNPYHFAYYVSWYASIALVAFGAGSLVVARRDADGPRRTLALGTLATFGGWIAATLLADILLYGTV